MTHDCTSTATETTTTTATATASTVSHESTPLTQATSSTARANIFGPPKPTPSSSRVRRWSGLFWKVSPVTIILLVSLSTIVLSFRLAATSISSRDRSNSALLPLSRPPQKQTRLRGSNEETELEEQDNPMKLSLWLVPPGGDGDEEGGASESESASETNSVFARTQKVIDDLSAQRNGPGFTPHVTLVGGIKVGSEPEALALAERLRNGLSGFGPVDCSFGNLVLSAPDCWNQALVLELVPPSEAFLRLCRASRKLLGMEQTTNGEESCLTFPPPLGVPHMSLYYGDSPPPPSDEYRSRVFGSSSNHEQSFRAHRVMLWKTDPSSAEGVPEWEPLADISLL